MILIFTSARPGQARISRRQLSDWLATGIYLAGEERESQYNGDDRRVDGFYLSSNFIIKTLLEAQPLPAIKRSPSLIKVWENCGIFYSRAKASCIKLISLLFGLIWSFEANHCLAMTRWSVSSSLIIFIRWREVRWGEVRCLVFSAELSQPGKVTSSYIHLMGTNSVTAYYWSWTIMMVVTHSQYISIDFFSLHTAVTRLLDNSFPRLHSPNSPMVSDR